jgi:hypothetical protein
MSRVGGRRTLVMVMVALVGQAALAGCHRRREGEAGGPPPRVPLTLSSVEVTTPEPGGAGAGIRLDDGALERIVTEHMLRSGLVLPPAPPGGPDADVGVPPVAAVRVFARVAAELIEVPPRAEVRCTAALRLDTRPSDAPGALADELVGSGEGELGADARVDDGAAAQRIAERTLGDLLDAYLARAHLQIADAGEIHALLAQDGPLREEAIRQVGLRHLRDEAPRLLELLRDDHEAVRDAALGALLALREPRTVRALTHSRALDDRREMRKILDALAVLGGREALEYLSFVAEGSSDEEIRTMAAEARDRLLRHLDAGT